MRLEDKNAPAFSPSGRAMRVQLGYPAKLVEPLLRGVQLMGRILQTKKNSLEAVLFYLVEAAYTEPIYIQLILLFLSLYQ